MDSAAPSREVTIPAGHLSLTGTLTIPADAMGLVLFAHGSGSSRLSPRNRQVAVALNATGLGTLLFDLLTPEEAADRARVFDIPLLAARLGHATTWIETEAPGRGLGYFGASTGAGAALWAATDHNVAAVVSRGGRPDLAGPRLDLVRAPTLLIVGSLDHQVIELNRKAMASLTCPHELAIVPDATHLFEEPGTLEHVAELAAAWFTGHLSG